MKTRIKMCGMTRARDAQAAIDAGADAIGFVLWPKSPRAVTVEVAAAIAHEISPVARVGVFVNPSQAEISAAVQIAHLDAVQLHGDERVEDFANCGAPIIRAVSVDSEEALQRALSLPAGMTLLVDTHDAVQRGGTGRVGDWAFARRLAEVRPVLLAGGLTPANVGEAIAQVRPWGIDVSSGVERAPGEKDPDAIARFCDAVRTADSEVV